MGENRWKTSITRINRNEIRLRGYRIDELMVKVSFADAVWLAFMGELPPPGTGKLVEAILVSSIDHGATPPSVLAARTVASGGAPLQSCLAGGILAIGKSHGGAVEGCMARLNDAVERREKSGKQPPEVASEIVSAHKAEGKRIPGYGHRIHTDDPRVGRLFSIAAETGISGKHIEMALAIEDALAKSGRSVPLNVDGAIAACLCDLQVPVLLANAFFLIARSVGIIAHVHEEKTRYKPMRRIDPSGHEYDGPRDRSIG